MDLKDWAQLLTGREIGEEISVNEARLAKSDGVVVVYGYSDDNIEFEGAIRDEVGCNDGGIILIDEDGPFSAEHKCDCDYCGFKARKDAAKKIEALWCKEGAYLWTYKTDIPHETFEIVEDGEPFCRGIVFLKWHLEHDMENK